MKLVSKTPMGRLPVYDLSVKDKEQYVFKNGIISHNTGIMYSSNTVLFVTKAQEKDGSDLVGYKFTLITEKSRYVREKAKFPLVVNYDKGIDKYTGLFDLCLDDSIGYIKQVKSGWYSRVINDEVEEKLWRKKDTNTSEFWDDILNDPKFDKLCQHKFKLTQPKADNSNEYVKDI